MPTKHWQKGSTTAPGLSTPAGNLSGEGPLWIRCPAGHLRHLAGCLPGEGRGSSSPSPGPRGKCVLWVSVFCGSDLVCTSPKVWILVAPWPACHLVRPEGCAHDRKLSPVPDTRKCSCPRGGRGHNPVFPQPDGGIVRYSFRNPQ